MGKKLITISIILVILLLIIGVSAVIFSDKIKELFGKESTIELLLFDAQGNLKNSIKGLTGQSVVQGTSGVDSFSIKVNFKNLAKETIIDKAFISSATPDIIKTALSSSSNKIVNPQETVSWISERIQAQPLEGQTLDGAIEVTYQFRDQTQKVSTPFTISISAEEIVLGQLTVDVGLGGNANPECIESWTCSSWSSCSNGIETRTCTDSNSCGTLNNKPITQQACTVQSSFQTNAINGNYKSNDVWISFNSGGKYFYNGYSSYNCLDVDLIVKTTENYPICTREGYTITERVYLDIGSQGLIFKL